MKKLLIIICSHTLDIKYIDNIKILNDYTKLLNMEIDYCGISSNDDFHNYETIISFKYKIVNSSLQFSKLCDFITDYNSELDYDWYMKIRPDVKLLENINFDNISENAVNARARAYIGPKSIKWGSTVNGEGKFKHIVACYYGYTEEKVLLDDMLFIFHRNIIKMGAFNKIQSFNRNNEWTMQYIYKLRNIPRNVIGINLYNTSLHSFSGHINIASSPED